MSFNKKTFIQALAESKRKKTSPKVQDRIIDLMGQWAHPGEITVIPGNSMATHGYGNIPLYVEANNGFRGVVPPNSGNIHFPGATQFTEYPLVKAQKGLSVEQKVNKSLGNPMKKAHQFADQIQPDQDEDFDNARHYMAGALTNKAIQNKFSPLLKYTGIPQVAGFLGSNILGLGHELSTLYGGRNEDPRPWTTRIRESFEDVVNNAIGATAGTIYNDPKKIQNLYFYLSEKNLLPDGIEDPNGLNLYLKKTKADKGRFGKYRNGGDISISNLEEGNWLDRYDDGGQLQQFAPGGSRNKCPNGQILLPNGQCGTFADLQRMAATAGLNRALASNQMVWQGNVPQKVKVTPIRPTTNAAGIARGESTSILRKPVINPRTGKREVAPKSDATFSQQWSQPLAREVDPEFVERENIAMGLTAAPFLAPIVGSGLAAAGFTPSAVGAALNAPILGTAGLTGNNLLWGAGAYLSGDQLIDPNSATRTSVTQAIKNPTFSNVAGAIGNTGMTALGFYGLPIRSGLLSLGDDFTRAGSFFTQKPFKPTLINSSVINTNIAKNLQDLEVAQKFAQQYGYELPANLERIAQSDELTNRTIRGMMDRHNTFVRGVSTNWEAIGKKNPEILRHLEGKGIDWQNNPKAAAEYMATHIPISTGYGRASLNRDVFDQGLEGLYTSNSIPTAEGYTYGQGFITKVKRPTNYSSANRQDWITQNNPEYYEHSLPGGNSLMVDGKITQPINMKLPYLYNVKDYDNVNVFKDKVLKDLEKNASDLKSMFEERALSNPTYSQNLKNSYDEITKQIQDIKAQKWETADVKFDKNLLKTEHLPKVDESIFRTGDNSTTIKTIHDEIIPKLKLSPKEDLQLKSDLIAFTEGYRKQGLNIKQIGEKLKLYLKEQYYNDPYAHYIHLGTPGQKVLEPIKSWEITPEIWKNKSRAHSNTYTKKLSALEEGGQTNWLDKYN